MRPFLGRNLNYWAGAYLWAKPDIGRSWSYSKKCLASTRVLWVALPALNETGPVLPNAATPLQFRPQKGD